jgi:membrane-anchored protein YejM (alkaline phosphatase superfamily)
MIALMITLGEGHLTRDPTFLIFPIVMVMSVAGMFMGAAAERPRRRESVRSARTTSAIWLISAATSKIPVMHSRPRWSGVIAIRGT